MKPNVKYRLKVALVAVFLIVVVDVAMFLLAENSVMPFNSFLIVAWTWNIILLITVLYLVNKDTKGNQTSSQIFKAS